MRFKRTLEDKVLAWKISSKNKHILCSEINNLSGLQASEMRKLTFIFPIPVFFLPNFPSWRVQTWILDSSNLTQDM